MRKAYALSVFFCSVLAANVVAQQYGNEWIDYSKSYYKLKITQEGIYRLDSLYLRNGGIPVSWLTDHAKLQVFHNGVEQYIYVSDANQDGTLNQNDFVEFYAARNDGSFDSQMYIDQAGNAAPNLQPNPRYSLYNDTAIYFLTWSTTAQNGLRVATVIDTAGFNTQPDAPYFTREVFVENTQGYSTGTIDGNSGTDMDYIEAEGWVDANISWQPPNSVGTTIKTVATQNIYYGGPDASYRTVVVGTNNNQKNLLIDIPAVSLNLASDIFYGHIKREYTGTILLSNLGTSTTNFRYRLVLPPDTQVGYAAFSYITLRYPHTLNFTGENASSYKLIVPDGPGPAKSDLEFTNFSFNGTHIFYDLTNHRRITGVQQGNQLSIFVPNSGGEKMCYVTGTGNLLVPAAIAPVSSLFAGTAFTKFTNFNSSTIATDSAYVIITSSLLWNEAAAYQTFRGLPQGGSYNTLLVDIDELYDQFAYGIRKHPLAIKNFARYMRNVWTAPPLNRAVPSYIFLIGKGYSPVEMRFGALWHNACIVPSMGYPSSDNLLTSGNGFPDLYFKPNIPIGRLAATIPEHVAAYRSKVEDYEAAQNMISPPPWMKEILHFGGGDDIWLQNQIRTYLDNYETIAEGCKFGGHVTSYYKTSGDVIQQNQSDSLQQQIDNGVCLMTFFGHAAASVGFDIATDHPSNYGNQGRYPLIIANSCFAGDIFTTNISVSEQFVLEPEKGAIGFLASVGLGSIAHLYMYTVNFYKAFSDTLYGGSFGNCVRYAIDAIDTSYDHAVKRVCLEMTLHGDPALKMPAWDKAELEVKQPDIFFSPVEITTLLDSFNVHVLVHNLARGVCEGDSFNVNIKRTFPDGTDTTYVVRSPGCLYSDTVTVNIPMDISRSAGLNTFDVYVDSVDINEVIELYNEIANNRTSTQLFILSSEIYPIYPYKYAIHPYSTVILKATTSDVFAPTRRYVFEIDTTDTFNSPLGGYHKQGFVTSSGGVVSWADNLPVLYDSVVYFWRVALDSVLLDTVNYHWNESSFIYIPAKTGWSQAHYFQFKNDKYETIIYDRPNREFDYGPVSRLLTCNTGWPYNPNYSIDNVLQDEGTCNALDAKINIAVIDTLTLEPWTTDTCIFDYNGSMIYQCGSSGSNCTGHPQPYTYFQFQLNDPAQMAALAAFLSAIPTGHYVLAFTFNTAAYSLVPGWLPVRDTLIALGSQMMMTIPDNRAFIFFVKKGFPSTMQETSASANLDTISLNAQLVANWYKGNIVSEIIGPAVQWNSLHWLQNPKESPTTKDSIHLQVHGITNAGIDTLLIDKITTGAYDTTLSFISTAQYPKLRLTAVTKDDSLRTPPQLKRWQIYYSEAPEAAINPNRHFQFHSNPIIEGDSIAFSVAIENIGAVPMDSIGVDYYLYDNNRNYYGIKSYKEDSLRIGQYVIAEMKYPVSFGWAGMNSLWVEANPFNATHQTEQYHFNNYGVINLKVDRDLTNPILDVTFDGVHILDRDIVSAKPHILVRLHDENKFLALNDTSAFTFFLKTPSQASMPIYFSNVVTQTGNLRFTAAALPKNSCRIEWDPNFTEDGIYELIIQGRDRSLNYSGAMQYKISFEVINRSTITNVLNYPNPFSTSTRFVFTLTGSSIPEYFKIQIMTISGKVVREITREELGNIHIGRNITDYAWNGRDEYGDQLANGIYLYRVITRINGSEIEKRETEADNFFKKGWGKMYLMR